jgi:hypothetical protein
VYIYLYSRVADHVNLDLSEARLRRVLPMLEKYRREHPDAHVRATILFSGAACKALAEANAKTSIKDYVLDFVRRGVIEPGYDATDEPTYKNRPVVGYSETATPEERWLARATAAKALLTESRDPLTGTPQPGVIGGLKETQVVFGDAVAVNATLSVASPIAGALPRAVTRAEEHETAPPPAGGVPALTGVVLEVGDDVELAEQVHRLSPRAIMFGLPNVNPFHLPGFVGSEQGFGRMLSPGLDTSPELYWQDGVLRSTEGSDRVVRLLHASDGADALKKVFDSLARSRIRIIHVEFGNEQDYLQPGWTKQNHAPLQYAYDHPDHPQVPPDARNSAAAVDDAFAKEDAALKWVLDEFIPANPGSRFVSSTDLAKMTPAPAGFSVSLDRLRSAVSGLLQKWGVNTFPPQYLFADGHYLSLANLFQVLTDAFAEQDRTGRLPESIQVVHVYGPLRTLMGHGPNVGEVTVADIAHTCAGIAARLHDDTESPVPKNAIPSGITVGGVNINAAQFLRLMATALVTPSADAKLRVRMTYLFPGMAQVVPKTRPMTEMGGTWTIKPAPLVVDAPARGQVDRPQ